MKILFNNFNNKFRIGPFIFMIVYYFLWIVFIGSKIGPYIISDSITFWDMVWFPIVVVIMPFVIGMLTIKTSNSRST